MLKKKERKWRLIDWLDYNFLIICLSMLNSFSLTRVPLTHSAHHILSPTY